MEDCRGEALRRSLAKMLLNLPIVNCVDVLVVGVDAPSSATALARRQSGQCVLAACGVAVAQELLEPLRTAGVEVLSEVIPVAPLTNSVQGILGWVFLSGDGYFAVQASEVVAAKVSPPGEAPLALTPGEELVWCCENPCQENDYRHISVEFPENAREVEADILVVGDGESGRAATAIAMQEGCNVICIGAFVSPTALEAAQPMTGAEHWGTARLGGVLRCRRQITGALCRDFDGKSYLVHSKVVIDATGNALVARAAGAAVSQLISDGCSDHTGWGASLGYVQLPGYAKEVLASAQGDSWDREAICRNDDDCRIVGELVIQPQDIILSRHYRDAIGVAHGSFEDVGSGVQSILMRLIAPGSTWDAWIPLRALLPRKVEGLLTLGRGLSIHWNALSMLRRVEDLRRLAEVAGRVAAAAVHQKCALREVPLRPIQQQLVKDGVLPEDVLAVKEDANTASPAPLGLALYQVATIFQRPDRARRQLQAAFGRQPTVLIAQILAFLGDSSGRDMLKHFLDGTAWEPPAPGNANTPVDSVILALQVIGGGTAALLRKLEALDASSPFSHLRAVCLYLQRWPMPEAIPQLEYILTTPGVAGNARHAGELFAQLRELYIAGALLACSPASELALRSLEAYRSSPHLPLAVYADQLLKS